MKRVSPDGPKNLGGQFGNEPLWKRPASELPAHLQTGLGGQSEPRQLKMFMSGNEIMDEYQPLDGDRRSIDNMEPLSNQATRPTPGKSADGPQYPVERPVRDNNKQQVGRYAWGNTTGGRAFERSMGGTARVLTDTTEETDDQVWDRKLAETKLSPQEYDVEHQGFARSGPEMSDISLGDSRPEQAKHEGTTSFEDREYDYFVGKEMSQDRRFEEKLEKYEDPENSLYNNIKKDGVQKPVSLGDPGNYSKFGMEGKPEIAGGHHRLSAQFDQDPDKLMPVLHFAGGTAEAKQNPVFKYS